MTRLVSFSAVAISLSLGLITGAQTRSDFSGRWTTDASTSSGQVPSTSSGQAPGAPASPRGAPGPPRGEMGSGWGSTITITQDATRLTVEYAFFARGDMQPPLKFVYALDGSETKNTVMMGRGMQTQVSKTAWAAGTLVITTRHAFTDPATGRPAATDVTQALTLESPAALSVETTRPGVLGGPATTTTTIYRKI